MKTNHIILILMLFVCSSCSIKTIEVIVEEEMRFKPDMYNYMVTIMDENLVKFFSEDTMLISGTGKSLLSVEKLGTIISQMDGIEIGYDQRRIANGFMEEGIELLILTITGENEFKKLVNGLEDYNNCIGRISGARLLDEVEKEKHLLKTLLFKAKQKAEFIVSEQNLNLGKVIKIEEVGETVIKEKPKKRKNSKIEPNGFEILNEKFIVYARQRGN